MTSIKPPKCTAIAIGSKLQGCIVKSHHQIEEIGSNGSKSVGTENNVKLSREMSDLAVQYNANKERPTKIERHKEVEHEDGNRLTHDWSKELEITELLAGH